MVTTSGRGRAWKDFRKKKDANAHCQRWMGKALRVRRYSASCDVKKITTDMWWVK
jgi:hypothetical protein